MKYPTTEEASFVRETLDRVIAKNGIDRWHFDVLNPYLLEVQFLVSVGKAKAVKTFNEIFHSLGVLPDDRRLGIGDSGDYCTIWENEDGSTYGATFNAPPAKSFKEGDEEYQFTLKAIFAEQETEAGAEEAEMLALIDGIKTGKLKSKSPDGYLVLKGEFYDAIESGKKKVEYRDFTEYNLKRIIGIKTIRFNRGHTKGAKQMQWDVKKVVLIDCEGNESDPFNVSDGFWPVAIAIHLGKRRLL
jgi:hypothetical protein